LFHSNFYTKGLGVILMGGWANKRSIQERKERPVESREDRDGVSAARKD